MVSQKLLWWGIKTCVEILPENLTPNHNIAPTWNSDSHYDISTLPGNITALTSSHFLYTNLKYSSGLFSRASHDHVTTVCLLRSTFTHNHQFIRIHWQRCEWVSRICCAGWHLSQGARMSQCVSSWYKCSSSIGGGRGRDDPGMWPHPWIKKNSKFKGRRKYIK
jgi:hypothetical protein